MAENNNCMRSEQCCMEPDRRCGCLGYGYVPVQEMRDVYCTEQAIMQGTVFPELDLDICEYGKVCKGWGGVSDDE